LRTKLVKRTAALVAALLTRLDLLCFWSIGAVWLPACLSVIDIDGAEESDPRNFMGAAFTVIGVSSALTLVPDHVAGGVRVVKV
jgi:hypothetical protein